MVSYNTTDVKPLCRTCKRCIYLGVCILILVLFFFVQQVISSVGSDFQDKHKYHLFELGL